jgi:type I restriction enzyme R subunit
VAEGWEGGGEDTPINTDYEPLAYSHVKIDYEYILNLIQDIVNDEETDDVDFKAKVNEVRGYITEFSEGNKKLGGMLLQILNDIEKDKKAFAGRNISEILSNMKRDAMNAVIDQFVHKWFVDRDAVRFAVQNSVHGSHGSIPNASVLKDSLCYQEYKEGTVEPLKKPKARSQMISELEEVIQEEIEPLGMM